MRDDLVGPLASMAYEHPQAWQLYVSDDSDEVVQAMTFAQERKLWNKYCGLHVYDPDRMGEIVHAIRLIFEGLMPDMDVNKTFSPGKAAPTYKSALDLIGP